LAIYKGWGAQILLQFSLLGSGSSGNAALVVSRHAKILIDSGLSFKQLEARVQAIGSSLDGLDAVFITHEHGDHVRGLGTLARKLHVPVHITAKTLAGLPRGVGALPKVVCFDAEDSAPIRVADMEIRPFMISHDAADPVSFTVRADGAKLGFACDVGRDSPIIRQYLAGSHALVLEANYCPDMLRNGRYPAQIKHRIRNGNGHLSNQDMCALLNKLLHDALRTVVLVHISENNNQPELVRSMAAGVLGDRPIRLCLASQLQPTELFEVRA